MKSPEFYVGYLPRMPAGLARFVAVVVALIGLGAIALSIGIPALHDDYIAARSAWPEVHDVEGVLLSKPVPHLVVARPAQQGASRYVLLGQGKTGPQIDVAALENKLVKVTGWFVHRDAQSLIAVQSAEAIPNAAEQATPAAATSLGTFTLRGEIVDSKCYFGTMRPGEGKVHRACAVRCIAGGVPPVLTTVDGAGNRIPYILVARDGSTVNHRVLELVAEPLEITGEVVQLDDVFVLKADPETYRRL